MTKRDRDHAEFERLAAVLRVIARFDRGQTGVDGPGGPSDAFEDVGVDEGVELVRAFRRVARRDVRDALIRLTERLAAASSD